jgi:hypothetical protein
MAGGNMTKRKMFEFYFEKLPTGDLYRCKKEQCGKIYKQKNGSGYTNLSNHLIACVGPYFEETYKESMRGILIEESHKNKGNKQCREYLSIKKENLLSSSSFLCPEQSSLPPAIIEEEVEEEEKEAENKNTRDDHHIAASTLSKNPQVSPFTDVVFPPSNKNTERKLLQLMIQMGLPIEEEQTLKALNHHFYNPISSSTASSISKEKMKSFFKKTKAEIMEKIKKDLQLSQRISLLLDLWSPLDTAEPKQCLAALYVAYTDQENQQYKEAFLGLCFVPTLDTDISEETIVEFIKETLDNFCCELSKVAALVSTTRGIEQIASQLGIPLVSSLTEEFQAALDLWLAAYFERHQIEPGRIEKFLYTFATSKEIPRLERQQMLSYLYQMDHKPTASYVWKQTYTILKIFFDSESSTLKRYLTNTSTNKLSEEMMVKLQALYEDLEKFESIVMALDQEGVNLEQSQFILEALCEDFDTLKECLADTCTCSPFTTGVVKVLRDLKSDLTEEEKKSLLHLAVELQSNQEQEGNKMSALAQTGKKNMSYVELLLSRKRRRVLKEVKYLNLEFIPATTHGLFKKLQNDITVLLNHHLQDEQEQLKDPLWINTYLMVQQNVACWNYITTL